MLSKGKLKSSQSSLTKQIILKTDIFQCILFKCQSIVPKIKGRNSRCSCRVTKEVLQHVKEKDNFLFIYVFYLILRTLRELSVHMLKILATCKAGKTTASQGLLRVKTVIKHFHLVIFFLYNVAILFSVNS